MNFKFKLKILKIKNKIKSYLIKNINNNRQHLLNFLWMLCLKSKLKLLKKEMKQQLN